MGLTYNQCKILGLAHLWPTESKPLPVAPAPPSKAPGDGMNKLERAFWERARDRFQGDVKREPLTFRLAGNTRYTPDFIVFDSVSDSFGPVCYEIKGFMRDDAAVKLKVAASQFPEFKWVLVTRSNRKWECREVTERGISREVFTPDWLR